MPPPNAPLALRRITPLSAASLRGPRLEHQVTPNAVLGPEPRVEWVPPESLLVDESYQRELTDRSVKLIRKIVAGFSWRRFKPPIVVALPNEQYEVIDGQHTAIGAATHPGVPLIPVLVTTVAARAERAEAFIGHNRDRIAVTPMQLFFSSLAAEDPEALTVKHVCDASGVEIVKYPRGRWQPRQTVAVGAIDSLVRRRYTLPTRRVLTVLAGADLAPITANQVRAVEALLFDREFRDQLPGDPQVSAAIRGLAEDADHQAQVLAATHGLPVWKALTLTYFRALRA